MLRLPGALPGLAGAASDVSPAGVALPASLGGSKPLRTVGQLKPAQRQLQLRSSAATVAGVSHKKKGRGVRDVSTAAHSFSVPETWKDSLVAVEDTLLHQDSCGVGFVGGACCWMAVGACCELLGCPAICPTMSAMLAPSPAELNKVPTRKVSAR